MGGFTQASYLIQLVLLLICSEVVAEERSKEFFLKPDVFSRDQVLATTATLKRLMSMECFTDHMLVTFRQESMLELGILPSQITFESRKCHFISNVTHYKADVPFRGAMCDSRYTEDAASNLHIIANTVVVTPPAPPVGATETILLDDEDGYGDYELVSSGSGNGAIADLQTIRLPFQCEYYNISSSTATDAAHPFDSAETISEPKEINRLSDEFTLEVFEEETISKPLTSVLTTSTDTQLYVQVKPQVGGKYEKAFLHNCYYHSDLEPVKDGTKYFIRNGCPIDPSVTYLDDVKSGAERLFSFKVHELYKSWTSLRCDLLPCALSDSSDSGLVKCGSQMAYCSSKQTHTMADLVTVAWPFALLISDPASPPYQGVGCRPKIVEVPCDCQHVGGDAGARADKEMEVELWIVILIAIAAFSIGSCSVVALWCIHVKTDSRHKMIAMPVSEPQSNDSQPSAQCKLMNETPP